MRSTLSSFVAPEKQSALDDTPASPPPYLLSKAKKKVHQNHVKSLADKTFQQAQTVFGAHLEASAPSDVSDQFTALVAKSRQPPKQPVVGKEETKEQQKELEKGPRKRGRPVELPQHVPEPTVIKSMEDLMACEESLALLNCNPQRAENPTSQVIERIPPQHDVIALCAQQYENNPIWYDQMIAKIIQSKGTLTVPDVPLFTREYLAPFFRQARPNSFERSCINLDRPAMPNEPKVRCIAHYMSEEVLGPGKGFRLRELLFKDEMVAVNRILADNEKAKHSFQTNKITKKDYLSRVKDPAEVLTGPHEMCVLCHIWMSNKAYIDKRDRAIERNSRIKVDGSGDLEDDYVTVLNRFMVVPDQPGEYALRMCIPGDINFVGIWGCFPIWNINNYVVGKSTSDGTPCFYETDRLLFQPARDLRQIDPSNSNRSNTTRSTHTLNSSLSFGSLE